MAAWLTRPLQVCSPENVVDRPGANPLFSEPVPEIHVSIAVSWSIFLRLPLGAGAIRGV